MLDQVVILISAIAWPLTTLTIFFSLRSEIASLVDRIKRLRHGETELDFNERLKEIVEAAEELQESPPIKIEDSTFDGVIAELLKIDPFSAILASWVEFSNTAHSALKIPDDRARLSPLRLIEKLEEQKLISEQDEDILHKIRGLRNHAAHQRTENIDHETAWKVCRVLQVICQEITSKRE